MKSAVESGTIEVAPDENQLIVAFSVLPRAVRAGVNEHMHALEDEAIVFVREIDDALHAKDIDPPLDEQILHPITKQFWINRTR